MKSVETKCIITFMDKKLTSSLEDYLEIIYNKIKENSKVKAIDISRELNVSISALFYTPDEKSFDETDLSKIDTILEDEILKALRIIKDRVKTMNQGYEKK